MILLKSSATFNMFYLPWALRTELISCQVAYHNIHLLPHKLRSLTWVSWDKNQDAGRTLFLPGGFRKQFVPLLPWGWWNQFLVLVLPVSSLAVKWGLFPASRSCPHPFACGSVPLYANLVTRSSFCHTSNFSPILVHHSSLKSIKEMSLLLRMLAIR